MSQVLNRSRQTKVQCIARGASLKIEKEAISKIYAMQLKLQHDKITPWG